MKAGITSIGIAAPASIVRNDLWHARHPDLIRDAERKTWMWTGERPAPRNAFERAMAPYLADPFRGAVERRWLKPGATALSLEHAAAARCLLGAGKTAADIDLIICTSFLPDSIGIGGAAFLARELGAECTAWNIESACSSWLIGLQNANALVGSGQYRCVLIVASCTYSRVVSTDDPNAWGVGDAAAAMLVTPDGGSEVLASHAVHTAETCGSIWYALEDVGEGGIAHRLKVDRKMAPVIQASSERTLRECSSIALERAGLTIADVDFLVVNTPLAWYHEFAAKELGIPVERTLSTYAKYSNVGPALLGVNLHKAMLEGKLAPGSNVLLFTIGSVSTACATVVRWGTTGMVEHVDVE